jgi:hypothetical protein
MTNMAPIATLEGLRRPVYAMAKCSRNTPRGMLPKYATWDHRMWAGIPIEADSRASARHHHAAANRTSRSDRPPGAVRRRHTTAAADRERIPALVYMRVYTVGWNTKLGLLFPSIRAS